MSTDRASQVFFELHRGLPRQGPGSNEATRRAWSLLGGLPSEPRVLDVGCGPGAQTLQLAQLTSGPIVAVDLHQVFLDELRERAMVQGVAERIELCRADMNELGAEFEPSSFDVIWSEGAIYVMGFETGLRAWRQLLRPRGYVAVTEACWLQSDPPPACRQFWNAAYPTMTDAQSNRTTIEECGYEPLGHFTLPEDAWWTEYYGPLAERLPAMRLRHAEDPVALQVLDEEEAEIEMFRANALYYGYVFFLARRVD